MPCLFYKAKWAVECHIQMNIIQHFQDRYPLWQQAELLWCKKKKSLYLYFSDILQVHHASKVQLFVENCTWNCVDTGDNEVESKFCPSILPQRLQTEAPLSVDIIGNTITMKRKLWCRLLFLNAELIGLASLILIKAYFLMSYIMWKKYWIDQGRYLLLNGSEWVQGIKKLLEIPDYQL